VLGGFTHQALAATEYEFTIEYQPVSGFLGQVWYFRIYDSVNNDAVEVADLASYPSLVGDSGSITFTVAGLPSSTTTEGLLTNATSTPNAVSFGTLIPDQDVRIGQRLSVDTTAISGYQVQLFKRQNLQNENADEIRVIAGTNASPVSWSVGCGGLPSCFGYHAGDDTLAGNSGRFTIDDTFAAPSTTPEEIMYSSIAANESEDIIYRIVVDGTQAPGIYTTDLVYLVTPQF
jgi:hypothetical protein